MAKASATADMELPARPEKTFSESEWAEMPKADKDKTPNATVCSDEAIKAFAKLS